MKITINISDKNNIEQYKKVGAAAFIFGLKNFNVNANTELDIDEIKEVIEKNPDIDIFISLDKNIFNHELDELKEKLQQLSKLNIKAVLFYDMAVLNIVKTNNINMDLVWNQTHMVTNYNTCNYYYDKGVKYAYVSSEITLEEIIEISKFSKIGLMVYLLGYPALSHSKRKLITNFYDANNYNAIDKTIKIKEKEHELILRQTNAGTSILGGNIINGTMFLNDLIKNDIKFIVLSDYMIEKEAFIQIIEDIEKYIKTNKKEHLHQIENLVGNNTHFFNKKTIFKVKKSSIK